MSRESELAFEIRCFKENIAQRKSAGLPVDFEEALLKIYQRKHSGLGSRRSKR